MKVYCYLLLHFKPSQNLVAQSNHWSVQCAHDFVVQDPRRSVSPALHSEWGPHLG